MPVSKRKPPVDSTIVELPLRVTRTVRVSVILVVTLKHLVKDGKLRKLKRISMPFSRSLVMIIRLLFVSSLTDSKLMTRERDRVRSLLSFLSDP